MDRFWKLVRWWQLQRSKKTAKTEPREEDKTKSRSISTVGGSGATCTRNFFELFFQNRWSFYGPVDLKNSKNFKKVKKKRQKCIDITLRKWSWRPLWQVGKKSISRFHSPPSPLWYRFGNFPEPSTCLVTLENCQKTKLFCKIWLWKRLKKAVILSEFWYFFSKNREKYKKIVKIPKKLKMNLVLCIVWYIFFSDFIFDVLIFKKIFFQ